MSKTLTPEDVDAAIRAFCTPLRVNLIRHYAAHPGSQALAVEALGESSANISRNTQALISVGVVVVAPDERGGRTYSIKTSEVWRLLGALGRHTLSEVEPVT